MFLFCVFSWLNEKYQSVTSMLIRFSSEISYELILWFLADWLKKYRNVILILTRFWSETYWMFSCIFWGLIILRLKNVYSKTHMHRDLCIGYSLNIYEIMVGWIYNIIFVLIVCSCINNLFFYVSVYEIINYLNGDMPDCNWL